MFNENVLEENLNEEEVLSDDSIFEDNVGVSNTEDDEDGVEFESFDDSSPD
jgi:hypothetical protein